MRGPSQYFGADRWSLHNCIGPTILIGREILRLPYAEFFCNNAIIRTHRESQCLPYAEFQSAVGVEKVKIKGVYLPTCFVTSPY